jgi:murein DD-endopeptidase MepM/ murein hydrolase activator NlpD
MRRFALFFMLFLACCSVWSLDWLHPLSDYFISSPFGFREISLGGGELSVHLGVDMVPNVLRRNPRANVPVLAAADGEVIIHYPPPGTLGRNGIVFGGHPTYGALIVLKHWDERANMFAYSIYGHMKQTWVFEGQKIKRGESMGFVGSTGKSTGPHLHFSIVYDPLDLLSKSKDGWQW